MNDALAAFNDASSAEAQRQLLVCCGARAWAAQVAAHRPYSDEASLLKLSEHIWFELSETDWLEAFACHPRIGEKRSATSAYLERSSSEQATAQQTLTSVADALSAGNELYEQRFGFRYIVFASGRSAPELLRVLESRLTRSRDEELREAARQQQQITRLRMTQWLYRRQAVQP